MKLALQDVVAGVWKHRPRGVGGDLGPAQLLSSCICSQTATLGGAPCAHVHALVYSGDSRHHLKHYDTTRFGKGAADELST